MRDADVAADAAQDRVRVAGAGLARHLRIGDQRPVHAEGVGDLLADHAVGIDRVDHPRRRDQGRSDAERAREIRDRVLRDGGWRDDVHAPVEGGRVADRDVHVVDEGRQRGRDRLRRRRVRAQADPEREPGRGLAHRGEHLGDEPRPLSVAIGAQVPRRVEELLGEIAVCGRDLDAVESRLGGQCRAAAVRADGLLHLGRPERSRLAVVAVAR